MVSRPELSWSIVIKVIAFEKISKKNGIVGANPMLEMVLSNRELLKKFKEDTKNVRNNN